MGKDKKIVEKKKHAGGRPTRYKAEYAEQAEKLCLLGATDKKLGDFFGVSEQTINAWKKAHPKFLESLRKSKDYADAEIVKSLYESAKGYSHKEEHVSNYMGKIDVTEITKKFPPNPTSMIFWLKNRQPGLYRDKHEVEVTNIDIGKPPTLEDAEFPDDES